MSVGQFDRRIVIVVVVLGVLAAGIVGYFLWKRIPALPARDSAQYQEYQRAFQVGVAAMDADQKELAQANLDRAVALIPAEPAGWANRGLFHLRNNKLSEAASDLKRAGELAPDSAEIEALLGVLAERQGRLPEAVAHLRKAVAKTPHDLPALYLLAKTITQERAADSEAENQKLLAQMLKLQPNNLPLLVEHVGAAYRNKDQAAVGGSLEHLAKFSPSWAPLSQKTFEKLRKAVSEDPKDVFHFLGVLNDVLKAERGYARDKRAIQPDVVAVGTPIRRFLRLEPVRPTPAPPDSALAFKVELHPAELPEKSRYDVIKPVWMLGAAYRTPLRKHGDKGGHRLWSAEAFHLALFVANAQEVRRIDGTTPGMPFPSGPKKVLPTSSGVLACDWNNDHLTDLILAGAGGLRFLQQQLDGTFQDVSARTGLPPAILESDYFGAWAADVDLDGDLDIIVARRSGATLLLRNNGDGTFKSMDTFASVNDARAFVWVDLDNDGAADAALLDAKGSLHVFSNERYGTFRSWPLPKEVAKAVAIAGADVNDDGVFDLIAARSDGSLLRISDQNHREVWEVRELVRGEAVAGEPGSIALLAEDLDNNCALDLVIGDGNSAQVFLADEKLTFSALKTTIGIKLAAVVDLHRDGRLDLIGLSTDGLPVRGLNQSTKGYRWQTIWALGNPNPDNQDSRINSFAVGGEVEIRCGPLVQKHPLNGGPVHFGLGDQPAVDVARIVWPNGTPQWEFDMPAFRFIGAIQRLFASCPFLFTWDGEQMRFAGDFMWGTPLGMYVNGQNIGDFPQTTEWLKIPGKYLVAKDGYYDVRVQANLWEIDYFDQLGLIVVDHPPNTELHVDERFFLTPTKPRMHLTTLAKPVARAWDHHGKDATDEIRSMDGRYLDRAEPGRFQGVVEDHWVEVEIGNDVPKDGPVLLVARGWLQPTNSSINVALSQGKHKLPRPVTLEVPDGSGGWKAVGPPLGFPAGKDKTMLIRLDQIGAAAIGSDIPRKIRLRTTMAIYWDFIGTARELDIGDAKLHRPVAASADLRYRGILEMTRKNESSPEVPIYDKVSHGTQPWRDLEGYYTRFGDVRELLTRVDDRYVIMNAGDEIAFRFPAPAPPQSGWVRDFIWECDGWTRDGDMNTRHGARVLPLPEHSVNVDLRIPGRLEDDPVYRRLSNDWLTFHTRYVTSDRFARGLRVR